MASVKLKAHLYSQLAPSSDLVLAELNVKALRKLGIKRGELIDTEKDIHPQTRKWAEAFHA